MHDASGQQGEEPRDHQAAAEDTDHNPAVASDLVAMALMTAIGSSTSTMIDSRWIGLQGPSSLIWWIRAN